MSRIIRSYLSYARGDAKVSPWALLYPLQYLTKAWMILRIGLYGRGLFSVTDPVLPVVSIGNNSLGGTNKTPMTELVVRQFLEAGIEAGLVSRGYRTKDHHEPIWVGQDEESMKRETVGDEPLMLSKRMPNVKVVVTKNRIKGVKLLSSLGVQVAVTDDTFQHRRMARDVDIVLVDSTCPFGNGQVLPAGFMREPMSAFQRADIVILTKANQVSKSETDRIKKELAPWVEEDNILTAEIKIESWIFINGDERTVFPKESRIAGKYIAFSAIGNPDGFYKYLHDMNIDIAAERSYRDHHIFTGEDIAKLEALADETGSDGFICTEKDLVNMPPDFKLRHKLFIPSIKVALDDAPRFRRKIFEKLKPRFMVASNGYGEDAIGVVLAKKMKERFKCAEVSAFAFVGSGAAYKKAGVGVLSPSSEMPSGGVIKYSIIDLIKDIKHGLGKSITDQARALRELSGKYRTPVCVGDVYLMANVLWGQGLKPILLATAKTVHLSGHLSVEEWLLRKRSLVVWARDEETSEALRKADVNAVFNGNPVMDLIHDIPNDSGIWGKAGSRVLLLPGSRPRAYDDVKLILDSALLLAEKCSCEFVMVPAPTIDMEKLCDSLGGWQISGDNSMITSSSSGTEVKIYYGQVAGAARGADLLIGLGGTANQLCAGLGLPVVSILETGKLRQKKLLREAEILVDAKPEELAGAAAKILSDRKLMNEMKEAGIRNLGGEGALDSVVEYCAEELGWDNRCLVCETYGRYLDMAEMACDKN